MPNFYIPLSGLNADSTALNTIANNLTNMNTTAFKGQTTNFSDLFYQQVGTTGSGDEIQTGTGVKVASNSTDFTGGSISSTGVETDAAISGSGFFVLDNNGSQLYTRNGNFQTSSTGTLESSSGLAVMGYSAANGVVNVNGGLTDITLPVNGAVMAPKATTTFGVTESLNSSAAIGTTTPGTVKVFDSLGQSYEAAITYTKTASNTWSYSIALPDTLSPTSTAAATISNTGGAAGLTQSSTTAAGVTTLSYNFSSSGGSLATVDPGTSLTITAATGGVPATATVGPLAVTANESLTTYAAALQTAINASTITAGTVTVTATAGGQLSIAGPSASLATAGIVKQDLTGTTTTYDFGTSGAAMATVDSGTTLTITGATAAGGTATITAPKVTAGTTATAYVAQLTTALTAAGITGVTVSGPSATGQVTITSLGTGGSIIQDAVPSANTSGTLTFDTSGNLLTPAANVSNITFGGLSDNSATMNMTWDLYGANGTGSISQTAGTTSSQSAETANGYASGTYNGTFTVGSDGIISASYSNSQTQTVGQLALATVSNLQGLADVGQTEYQVTGASGLANVGVAGTQGLGTLQGSSLEASNVNISAQFSDLIVAQRAFEANAKSVTTFDSITQSTINMIH